MPVALTLQGQTVLFYVYCSSHAQVVVLPEFEARRLIEELGTGRLHGIRLC